VTSAASDPIVVSGLLLELSSGYREELIAVPHRVVRPDGA
jgi:hypothetical protein